jgi:hypothetical protein
LSTVIDKLNTEINAALADPKIKARLAGLGRVLPGSPAGGAGGICSCCDRGQIYCAGGCAQEARYHAQRAAGRR